MVQEIEDYHMIGGSGLAPNAFSQAAIILNKVPSPPLLAIKYAPIGSPSSINPRGTTPILLATTLSFHSNVRLDRRVR